MLLRRPSLTSESQDDKNLALSLVEGKVARLSVRLLVFIRGLVPCTANVPPKVVQEPLSSGVQETSCVDEGSKHSQPQARPHWLVGTAE